MRSVEGDPYRERVYAAETQAAPDGGRTFPRFIRLEEFVVDVVTSEWWIETFPDAPIEVQVMRRSRGATFSAAAVDRREQAGCVWIRSGSWDLVTVLHELAHVASNGGWGDPTGPHGDQFVGALCELWREHLGFHAYGALQSELSAREVPLRSPRRD